LILAEMSKAPYSPRAVSLSLLYAFLVTAVVLLLLLVVAIVAVIWDI